MLINRHFADPSLSEADNWIDSPPLEIQDCAGTLCRLLWSRARECLRSQMADKTLGLIDELKDAQSDIDTLQTQKDSMQEQINALNDELDEVNQALGMAQSEINNLRQENRVKDETIARLTRHLPIKDSDQEELPF